jgi:hypothetical protein
MPLADVIGFENGGFTLDHAVIHQMVDAATTADPRHTPSTAKREAGKIDTQAMYASWQKAYRALLKKSPGNRHIHVIPAVVARLVGRLVFVQSTRPRPQHHQETHEILK